MSRCLGLLERGSRGAVVSFVLAMLALGLLSVVFPGFGFGNPYALRSLAVQVAILALPAFGQGLIVLAGGFDLSIPWVMCGAAVTLTMLTGSSDAALLFAVPLVLAGAGLVGLINGLLIARYGLSPIIATLGMNAVLLGAVSGLVGGGFGAALPYGVVPDGLVAFAQGRVFGVPLLVLTALTVGLTLWLLLGHTPLGRKIYAVGTNPEAAFYAGIDVTNVTVLVYVAGALLSAAAGILLAAHMGQAYLGSGDTYLFASVTVAVIGGIAVTGGQGTILGILTGAFFLVVLDAAVPLLDLPRGLQLIVYGLAILASVLVYENPFGSAGGRWRRARG